MTIYNCRNLKTRNSHWVHFSFAMEHKIELFSRQLQDAVANECLKLPSLPDIALKAREACEDESASAQTIAELVAQDPALSVRLLQVANSSLYRTRSAAENLNMAITRLGLKLVKDLIIGLAIKQLYRASSRVMQNHLNELWLASTKTAAISRLLASSHSNLNPEQAMLAGLTHNIGALPILMLAENDEELLEDTRSLCTIIRSMQGDIGAYLFKAWHFPNFMGDVVTNCYNFDRYHEGEADYIDIVQVALIESSIYTGLDCPDDWSSVPAFHKLNIGTQGSILDIGDNKIIFDETHALFH